MKKNKDDTLKLAAPILEAKPVGDSDSDLKHRYLLYYLECPIQKYAAMYIGRNEDTILRWKKEDSDFADRIEAARAVWVRKKLKKANVDFALERLEKEVFGDPDKARDIMYEKFQQFIFIFTLKPDELRRFIEAGLTRASVGSNSDSSGAPQPAAEAGKGEPVGGPAIPK